MERFPQHFFERVGPPQASVRLSTVITTTGSLRADRNVLRSHEEISFHGNQPLGTEVKLLSSWLLGVFTSVPQDAVIVKTVVCAPCGDAP